MAQASLPIPPFSSSLNREAFGYWLSGFSDGESCFQLRWSTHHSPVAIFVLALRKDDSAILETIQSFWQCGRLYAGQRMLNSKKFFVTMYSIQRINDLASIIVPHFEAKPLQSKKSRDFAIWKEGVALIASRDHRGLHRRWAPSEIDQFTLLHDSLRASRPFTASA